jgi:alkanesulfonate monooxygenase SsuD/methylene tetrahydromethanopterin reductase-like flavin-dependent oxidoreductase (luciferase family)
MHFGIHIPPFGPLSDARTLADLAGEAEQAGWDGFFLWDDVTFDPPIPVGDPWIALTAIALRTQRIRLGPLVTPLPRRRPWKVAREAISLDHLSRGRLILGVGTGGSLEEFADMGEEKDPKVRAAMLEEGLQIITGLWTGETFHFEGTYYHVQAAQFLPPPVQSPRIPIWVAGGWPNKAPFRRAARWDGMFPQDIRIRAREMMEPSELQSLLNYIAPYRQQAAPFEVVHLGMTSGEDVAYEQTLVASYAAVGVTWWLEDFMPQRFGGSWSDWPLEQMRHRLRQGPPHIPVRRSSGG